jgi:hypothetical protein
MAVFPTVVPGSSLFQFPALLQSVSIVPSKALGAAQEVDELSNKSIRNPKPGRKHKGVTALNFIIKALYAI